MDSFFGKKKSAPTKTTATGTISPNNNSRNECAEDTLTSTTKSPADLGSTTVMPRCTPTAPLPKDVVDIHSADTG